MKTAVQKNHLVVQILYRRLDPNGVFTNRLIGKQSLIANTVLVKRDR